MLMIFVTVLAPLLIVASIWLPVIGHYYVPSQSIGPEEIESLRGSPNREVEESLGDITLLSGIPDSRQEILQIADGLLDGRLSFGTDHDLPISIEPTDETLSVGNPTTQLLIAGLGIQEILLRAFEATGEERYYQAALRSTVAWARFERAHWLPVGALWNDHAIAARLIYLCHFWSHYRRRPDFDPSIAREVLLFVARSAEMLARDSHYTYRTNHGIMQNIGLLHAGTALPSLPGAPRYVEIALERTSRHLEYYVSPRGIILEHSAGYQSFGVRLLRHIRTYLRLLGRPEPQIFASRYHAARCYLQHIQRPDGSLPPYGDTEIRSWRGLPTEASASHDQYDPVSCGSPQTAFIDPDFGHASIWSADPDLATHASHLFVAWANFPGRAHKHADELTAFLWHSGQEWWAASGYWPYGDADRADAEGWSGSNAPHLLDESPWDTGNSQLLGYVIDDNTVFLDLERVTARGCDVRRQILTVSSDTWTIIDHAGGACGSDGMRTVWTLMPEVTAEPALTPHRYNLRHRRSNAAGQLMLAGGQGHAVQEVRASREPFGGLVAIEGQIMPSIAFFSEAPLGSWTASIWRFGEVEETSPGLHLPEWRNAEDWSITLPGPTGTWSVGRNQGQLTVTPPSSPAREWTIAAGSTEQPALRSAANAYRQMAEDYPRHHDYLPYRNKATVLAMALFVGQFPAIWVLRRLRTPTFAVQILTAAGWLATFAWCQYWYLA